MASPIVILISADAEWQAVCQLYPKVKKETSPYGEWFLAPSELGTLLYFQGGWGKISAAASTQYAIDRWSPELLVNLGTCGGFAGEIERGAVILVERTLVYDIVELMGDPAEHIAHYTTDIDLSWLEQDGRAETPQAVRRALLVSADRDLHIAELPGLKETYGAIAGDWESGAIAYVAARNHTRLLILRGVTDLVGEQGGEAYGNLGFFQGATAQVMEGLIKNLPAWVAISQKSVG